MDPVVIVSAVRTPIGAFCGKFKSLSAVELGSVIIKCMKDNIDCIDSVYMGNVLSAGLGQSPCRQAVLGSGLELGTNCFNINKVCGSSMAALMFARNAILCEDSEVCVAGGMESMTNAPYLLMKGRLGYRFGDSEIVDHMVRDGLFDVYGKNVMGVYADETAEEYSISRETQDTFAENSFKKARVAIENHCFENEIIGVNITEKKNKYIVDTDEIPFSVDLTRIPSLKPAFKKNGSVTAASASSISDGAAGILLMKESKAKELNLNPIARIVAQACHSHDPGRFTTAPIDAIKKVLEKSNWFIGDVDLFEINEAFAVVTLAAMKELAIEDEKVNVFGGACALGHPLGASGARIVVTLLNALRQKNLKRGLATLCVGGGEATAMTFEMF